MRSRKISQNPEILELEFVVDFISKSLYKIDGVANFLVQNAKSEHPHGIYIFWIQHNFPLNLLRKMSSHVHELENLTKVETYGTGIRG